MNQMTELFLSLLVLGDIALLGTNRVRTCIAVVAVQGALLGLLTLLAGEDDLTLHGLLLALASIGIKGALLPYLLDRAMRLAEIRGEVEPLVSYNMSMLIGIAFLAASLEASRQLPQLSAAVSPLAMPACICTMCTGLFLSMARRKAIMQALGYLTFESGIYGLGVLSLRKMHYLVELGVLLDLFVAVLVLSIAVHHISREFDETSADSLSSLKG